MLRLAFVLTLGLALLVPGRASAQATPYVPDLDPAYRDMDALIAGGWVRTAITGKRPYSRRAMAGLIAEAKDRVARSERPVQARFIESLARLEEVFAPELEAREPTHGALRSASTDLTLADSPDRAIPTSYDTLGSQYIDADLNPLLQKNQGRVLADGATLGAEALADFTLGGRVAGQIHPRVWASAASRGGGGGGVTLLEGYARALFGNFSVEAGRNHIAQGHGPEAGPMFSHNARGLDMVRFSLDRSPQLPWVLSSLGRIDASMLMADMGSNRDQPHSKLFFGQASWAPVSWLELGAALLNQQGGEGSPAATLHDRIYDIFLIFLKYPNDQISDKVVGGDIRVAVPALRSELWAQVMSTDDHRMFKNPGQALVTEAVWIAGMKTTGLGPEGRLDVWAEGRRAGVRPHTHHQETSGVTLDRRVIGDAMGPLGQGISAGVDWRGPTQTASLYGALERYNGADRYEDLPGGKFDWTRTVDNPDEIRVRVVADWSTDARAGHFVPTFRLGYEHVERFAFTANDRSNLLAQAKLDYRW